MHKCEWLNVYQLSSWGNLVTSSEVSVKCQKHCGLKLNFIIRVKCRVSPSNVSLIFILWHIHDKMVICAFNIPIELSITKSINSIRNTLNWSVRFAFHLILFVKCHTMTLCQSYLFSDEWLSICGAFHFLCQSSRRPNIHKSLIYFLFVWLLLFFWIRFNFICCPTGTGEINVCIYTHPLIISNPIPHHLWWQDWRFPLENWEKANLRNQALSVTAVFAMFQTRTDKPGRKYAENWG